MSITGVVPPVEVILLAVPLTLVTVPAAAAAQVGNPPESVSTCVFEPTGNLDRALVPDA